MAIVERLCKCHAIALAAQNKQAIHLLYDALLERFVRLGDYVYGGASHGWQRRGGGALVAREPLAATDGARAQIDGLTRVLFDLSATMPEAAAALWRRRIVAIQAKVAAAVRAPTDSESGGGAWPSAGSLLALKLLSTLFPTSDARHGVTTPAALLIGQCLSQCAVVTRHDLVRGLFCTGLALHYAHAGGARRVVVVPEAIAFLESTLLLFALPLEDGHATRAPAPPTVAPRASEMALPTLASAPLAWLRAAASEWCAPTDGAAPAPVAFAICGDDAEFAASVLTSACALAVRASAPWTGDERAPLCHDSFPELFGPVCQALRVLTPDDARAPLASPLASVVERVQNKLAHAAREIASARKPLALQAAQHAPKANPMLAPRFEENYTVRKDKDSDRQKAQLKRLKRDVGREKRAAVRELRRDAAFSHARRAEDVAAVAEERKRERATNRAWLEQQQATINQAVRQGGGLMKRKDAPKQIRLGVSPNK